MSARFNALAQFAGICVVLACLAHFPGARTAAAQREEYEDALRGAKAREQLLRELSERAREGRHAEVLSELRLISARDRGPRFGNLEGVCLAGLGRHREAVAVYESALRQDFTRAELHRNLAISLQELGMTGRAFAEFEDAVRMDPDDPETRLALGESLLHFGRLDRAVEELERAERGLAMDPRLHRALARASSERGDAQGELRAWSLVDSLDGDADSARALARLAGSPQASLEWYRACAERDSSAHDCWGRIGELLLAGGDVAGAASALARAVDVGAGEAALHNLYLSLQLGGELDRLEELILSQPPPRAASWGAVALARREAERPAAALDAAQRGREMDGEDLVLANLEAVLQMETGSKDRAEEIWRWILQRDPAHAQARANLGLD